MLPDSVLPSASPRDGLRGTTPAGTSTVAPARTAIGQNWTARAFAIRRVPPRTSVAAVYVLPASSTSTPEPVLARDSALTRKGYPAAACVFVPVVTSIDTAAGVGMGSA